MLHNSAPFLVTQSLPPTSAGAAAAEHGQHAPKDSGTPATEREQHLHGQHAPEILGAAAAVEHVQPPHKQHAPEDSGTRGKLGPASEPADSKHHALPAADGESGELRTGGLPAGSCSSTAPAARAGLVSEQSDDHANRDQAVASPSAGAAPWQQPANMSEACQPDQFPPDPHKASSQLQIRSAATGAVEDYEGDAGRYTHCHSGGAAEAIQAGTSPHEQLSGGMSLGGTRRDSGGHVHNVPGDDTSPWRTYMAHGSLSASPTLTDAAHEPPADHDLEAATDETCKQPATQLLGTAPVTCLMQQSCRVPNEPSPNAAGGQLIQYPAGPDDHSARSNLNANIQPHDHNAGPAASGPFLHDDAAAYLPSGLQSHAAQQQPSAAEEAAVPCPARPARRAKRKAGPDAWPAAKSRRLTRSRALLASEPVPADSSLAPLHEETELAEQAEEALAEEGSSRQHSAAGGPAAHATQVRKP